MIGVGCLGCRMRSRRDIDVEVPWWSEKRGGVYRERFGVIIQKMQAILDRLKTKRCGKLVIVYWGNY